jgi:restriction system protein
VSRGVYEASDRGKGALAQAPERIDIPFLRQYPEFRSLRPDDRYADAAAPAAMTPTAQTAGESDATPEERIAGAVAFIEADLRQRLLQRVLDAEPSFFEQVVVDLLLAMGYGTGKDAGEVRGKSGDGGIDGVIRQDKLGLDVVCIQAKRWEGPVGRPVDQGFVGSMDYIRARKGVIMTTSIFTKDAVDFVDRIEGKKVVLIGGAQLATLMIEHHLGVTTTKTYELKEVSNDFFDESEG